MHVNIIVHNNYSMNTRTANLKDYKFFEQIFIIFLYHYIECNIIIIYLLLSLPLLLLLLLLLFIYLFIYYYYYYYVLCFTVKIYRYLVLTDRFLQLKPVSLPTFFTPSIVPFGGCWLCLVAPNVVRYSNHVGYLVVLLLLLLLLRRMVLWSEGKIKKLISDGNLTQKTSHLKCNISFLKLEPFIPTGLTNAFLLFDHIPS